MIPVLAALSLLGCTPSPPPPEDYGPAPAFSLTDQNGTARTLADFSGKVWVADFIFTSCSSICPTLTKKMAAMQVKDPWATFVSFSVDPGTDTPPVLLAYAEKFHASPGWYFLTGPTEDLQKIVVDGFKQAMDITPTKAGDPPSILHGDRFIIIDGNGHIRGYPEADDPEVDTILAALKPT